MELDEYKTVVGQKPFITYNYKAIPELEIVLAQRTESLMDTISKSLRLELVFALLFLLFDGYLLLFSAHNYLRILALLLLTFTISFIFYIVKLLKSILFQHILLSSVKHLLESYISIIHRFTRLYFQLTMVMIPLIFLLAFVSGYLDYRSQPLSLNNTFSLLNIWAYIGISALWSFAMYFFTKWYIKKLYGEHLNKLKEQLKELQND
ncbi:MAG: hypothetical protein ABIN89_29155 [Chitinophagaceae bacterium]